MNKKSLFDRDNIELFILSKEQQDEITELLAWDETIDSLKIFLIQKNLNHFHYGKDFI